MKTLSRNIKTSLATCGLSVFFTLAAVQESRADQDQKFGNFTHHEYYTGVPIITCLANSEWEKYSSTDSSQERLVFVEAAVFDSVSSCITDEYSKSNEGSDNHNIVTPKDDGYVLGTKPYVYPINVPTVDRSKQTLTLNGNPSVVRADFFKGSEPQTPINSLFVNGIEYLRTPSYPNMCDEVKDPISKKWCTGELQFSGYKNQNGCKNSRGDACGTKYLMNYDRGVSTPQRR